MRDQMILFLATGLVLEVYTFGLLVVVRYRRLLHGLMDIMARDIARMPVHVREKEREF